ncbi:MAG: DUF3012 domain-containing protein [Rhodospirillaceae bacterium]|nr:MAG: DUF3012 domain-containing protein [Rhodospirillaceae bacterium]
MKKALTLGFVATFVLAVAACSPTVGTPEWCTEMKDKPKGDWTANEATEFAKNCLM